MNEKTAVTHQDARAIIDRDAGTVTREGSRMRGLVGALLLLAGCVAGCAAPDADPDDENAGAPAPTPTHAGEVEVARIRTPDGVREIGFRRLGDGMVIFDGDILLDERELGKRSAITTVGSLRWPSGVVYYEIDPALTQQTRVTQAIAHWEANTPYRFFPRQGQASYIRFVPHATDCSSQVGRQSSGQVINLATGCGLGATIHEIGHAIGMFHEQTRHDRDSYVVIHPECIEPGKEFNFSKYSTGADVGPYDYLSIMHYPRSAFSTGCETITPLDPQAPVIGQRSALSAGDIMGAWRIFNGARPGVHPVPADYDGDGKTDFAIKDDTGVWRIDYAANGFGTWDVVRSGYGGADALPVPADYDGDGKADLSVKTNDGTWFVDYASSPQDGWNVIRSGYGNNTGVPVPADYDGDGKADFSVKACDGTWFVDHASSPQDGWNVIRSGYGDCSGVPVPADYDGDGKADFSIKGSDGTWFVDYSSSPQDGWNVIRSGYGGTDVVPVPADYDGDGKADFSVKSNAGIWFIDYSSSPQDGWNVVVGGYGDASSIPVPGNYDGLDADGKKRADLSVKAVGDEGAWFVDRAATGFGAWDFYKPLGV